MASRFERIVAAIKAQLDIDVPSNTVTFLTDVKDRNANRNTNEVVWVRLGGRVEEADQAGSMVHDSEESPGTEVASVPIKTDAYDVEADVWAADQEAADDLREAIVRAAHNTLYARSVVPGRWRDLTQDPDDAGHLLLGVKHRVEFQFLAPIAEFATEQELVTLTSETHPCTFEDSIENPTEITKPV